MGQFGFRIPDEAHTKARVIAAYENTSLNEFCVQAVENAIEEWEKDYGKIPIIVTHPK